MSPMTWSKLLEIGHKNIDREHRELLDGANAVEAELTAGDFAKANARCRALRDLLQRHFAHEEQLLNDVRFARSGEHVDTHVKAQREVESILSECHENCPLGLKMGCPARWCAIIVDHVLLADLDFKSYLENRGII
jgi:hemerythrin-like metal-binding protein